jgi:hypothetical protein
MFVVTPRDYTQSMHRRVQIQQEELPLYFEGVMLDPRVRYAGWPVAAAGMAVGTFLVGTADTFPVELLGVLLAGSCALLFVALIRCRRYESALGTRTLTVGTGPFKRRIPIGYLDDLEIREAGSWRSVYADREIEIRLRVGDRSVVIPSDDPEALISAIEAARH